MKNFKLYNKILKKGKYVLLPSTLASIIILSGCSIGKTNSNNYDNSNCYYNIDNSEIEYEDTECAMKKINDFNTNKTNIRFTKNNLLSFVNSLNNVDVKYNYSSIYNINSSLSEYNKINLVSQHKYGLKELNADELFKTVIKNNKNMKSKNYMYEELGNKELRQICSTIIETVKDYISTNSNISEDRIKCVLSDLKIFEQKSALCNAFVTDDNYLVVSPSTIQISQIINGTQTSEDILIHEINHLLQKGCNCDLEANNNLKHNFGVSYKFKNQAVNSLNYSWLYESTAEKSMSMYTKHNIFTYKTLISYLESLNLSILLNDNYNIGDVENLSYKRSLDDLYQCFNVTADKDKQELLDMMYSIEIMQQEPDDFYNKYKELMGVEKSKELVDKINYDVKSSICQTITKLFYKNLSNSIVDKDVTLEDIFYLISLFENDLNNHLLYTTLSRQDYNNEFITTYINIQNNFFSELSKCLGISQENVEEYFDNYASKTKLSNGSLENNFDLNFLSFEKQKYLEQRQNELSDLATISIRKTNQKLNGLQLKKVY